MQSLPTLENCQGPPPGGILTTMRPDRTVVRLTGDIDLSMAEEFGQLLLSLPTKTAEILLDVSDLTFADSTLINFVALMHAHLPVTVAPPNTCVVELLRLTGLADQVRILENVL